ncbi:MAG: glycoside hydrolase family 36 protein [Promethearchaeota archaeon]
MDKYYFENQYFNLIVDCKGGTLSLLEKSGGDPAIFLKRCKWGYRLAGGKSQYSSDEFMNHSCLKKVYEDNIGTGESIEIHTKSNLNIPGMLLKISFYATHPGFLIELVVVNPKRDDVCILEMYPLVSTKRDGSGLFFSKNPAQCRILEAGLAGMLDLNVRCVFGDDESDSNGNILVKDLDSGKSFCCGVIERPSAMVEIITNEDDNEGFVDEVTGKKSFGDWKIKKNVVPCKIVRPGGNYSSNRFYFNLDPNLDEFEKLEDYASKIATFMGIHPWPRHRSIPHGWNSWGNPADTDPYEGGQNQAVLVHYLTEENVLGNFQLAYDNLARYGFEYFQIDDGYQTPDASGNRTYGDWEARRDRFPHGLKPVFDKIHALGMKTGLWIRPFEISLNSKIYKEHPEWGLEWEESFPMKSKAEKPLDVSRVDVQNWLKGLFLKFKNYFGVEWIKTDFTYNILGGKGFQDETMTAVEAMVKGFSIIREAVGPEIFLTGIGGPCLFHYGLVNAERLTLDVQPGWGKDGEMMPIEQGIKPNSRIIARRYYLHNRVWFTHCDVLQFRQPLKRNEYLVQATVIALAGGVFKVGEKFTNLLPEHFDVISKMLPIYRPEEGRGMRPIDLFSSEYPEVWDLLVDDPNNGLGEYHVVGLFNWGENVVLGQEIPPEPRRIHLDFKSLGLVQEKEYVVFEFWEECFKGSFTNFYEPEIEPRHVELVVLRENLWRPQFISSNRHITQGATDILSTFWDPVNMNLEIKARGVPDNEHHYHIHVPEGYDVVIAQVNDRDAEYKKIGKNHVNVIFKNGEGEEGETELEIRITFYSP